jgi:hypothetical protein
MKLSIFFVTIILSLSACTKFDTNKPAPNVYPYQVVINFKPYVGNVPLQLSNTYTNTLNETFKPNILKWYVSNWQSSVAIIEPQYFLADAGLNNLTTIIKVNKSNVNQLSFLLGVDSARNVSGAQSGALDPLNGMFWTWNSGYIMFKLEGTSPLSNQLNNIFEYHVGGFRTPNNVATNINLVLPAPLVINRSIPSIVDVKVDLLPFFKSVETLPIASQAVSVSPGVLAKKYANNFPAMFSVLAIRNF